MLIALKLPLALPLFCPSSSILTFCHVGSTWCTTSCPKGAGRAKVNLLSLLRLAWAPAPRGLFSHP